MESYNTIAKEAEDEFIEKRSRFIGAVCPVSTEAEALEFIEKRKTQYWQATHNCWAYVLKNPIAERYSDDGEPQGTAGIPILEVLRKEEIFNAVIVVTRYYGGIQLGGGGLVRAYSQGAKLSLDAGGRIVMASCQLLRVALPYPLYDRFLSLAHSYPMKVLDTNFAGEVSIKLRLRSDYLSEMQTMLTELSSGEILAEVTGTQFAPI